MTDKLIERGFGIIYLPWGFIKGRPLPVRVLLFFAGWLWIVPAIVIIGPFVILLIIADLFNAVINPEF